MMATSLVNILWTFVIIGLTRAQNEDEDIAFNKSATQSSTYTGDVSRYGAQFAVNGLAKCDTEDGPVAQTNWESAHWKVDLLGKYFIRTVEIWPRTLHAGTYASKLNIKVDDDIRATNWFSESLKNATYFAVNKIGTSIKVDLWDKYRLSLCHVKIYGEALCDNPMKYGPNCHQTCPTNCTNWCRKKDGWCPKCEDGYKGEDCKQACAPPCKNCDVHTGKCFSCYHSFGDKCDEQCANGCDGNCNTDTGKCPGVSCKEGFYGKDFCELRCSSGCKTGNCLRDAGHCTACKPNHNQVTGYQCIPCPIGCKDSCNRNLYCTQCKEGRYGDRCQYPCSSLCETSYCEREHGRCQCQVGYAGHPCQKCPDNCDDSGCDNTFRCFKCKSGFYGSFCNKTCSQHCRRADCSRADGQCECAVGFVGHPCRKCPNKCDQTGCTETNGKVLCRNCKVGYAGVDCVPCPDGCENGCENSFRCDACQIKQYGVYCNETCAVNCREHCSRDVGKCDGCIDGYQGDHCNQTCHPNSWGTGCNQTCYCASGSCHHVSGSCGSVGCVAGRMGQACQLLVKDKGNNMAVIGGALGTVAVLLLLVVAAVVLLIYRKRKQTQNQGTDSIPMSRNEDALTDRDLSKGPLNNNITKAERVEEMTPNPDAEIYQNMSIPVSELPVYIQRMKERGDGFQKEFKKLPVGLKFPAVIGSKKENIKKNRFKNIIAYDHSIVKLEEEPGCNGHSYINANFIQDYHNQKSFIAAQGPLQKSESDFIRLLWEQNVPLVVMVTKLVENQARKCEPYWPDDYESSMTFGDISVSASLVNQSSHYTIRKLTLTKGGESKEISHIQYKSWPDHGVPKCPSSFLEFHKMAQEMYQPAVGPTVVHCSSGVGKTGTFLAVDYLLKQAIEEDRINVVYCLDAMRKQRTDMVQSLDQYIFIYETVMESLLCGQTTYPVADYGSTWKAVHRAVLAKQFETLNKMKRVFKETDFSAAHKDENAGKNRNPKIVSANINRARLMTAVPDRNDYINAVFVQGHQKKNEFLVTQWPFKDTVVDLWRLCVDYKVTTVIALNNTTKENMVAYWPSEDTNEVEFGPFTVVKEHETKTQLTRDMSCRTQKTSCQLRQFMVDIPSNGLPDKAPILAVYEYAKRWNQTQPDPCSLIHCLDGADTSGLFLALWLICDKITDEQEVDVFHAVKQIRATRPQFVTNLEQYVWLHEAAESYLETFSSYANFK